MALVLGIGPWSLALVPRPCPWPLVPVPGHWLLVLHPGPARDCCNLSWSLPKIIYPALGLWPLAKVPGPGIWPNSYSAALALALVVSTWGLGVGLWICALSIQSWPLGHISWPILLGPYSLAQCLCFVDTAAPMFPALLSANSKENHHNNTSVIAMLKKT